MFGNKGNVNIVTIATGFLGVALFIGGCGGGDEPEGPLVEPPPTAAGTLSEESRNAAVLRDAQAIRQASDSTGADEALQRFYATLNEAAAEGKENIDRSAAIIRNEVPPLLETITAGLPESRRRVATLRLKTTTGQAFRRLAIYNLDQQNRSLARLASDLETSDTEWGPIATWTDRSEAHRKEVNRRLSALLASAPPDERAALARAARELSGQ